MVGAECAHAGHGAGRLRAGDHRHAAVEQPRGGGDGQVRLVVGGERQHAAAQRVAQAGGEQRLGQCRVRVQDGRVQAQVLEFELGNAPLVLLDDHEAHVAPVEQAGHALAGVAGAADQVEGLAHPAHLSGEADLADGPLEGLVLEQRQRVQQRVGPGDDGQVDHDHGPQPLRVGEGVRHLAEADRGGGVADEVQGVKEAHRRRRRAVGTHAGDQREAEHRHRVGQHDHDQRRAKPPQDHEQHALGGQPGALARSLGASLGHRQCSVSAAARASRRSAAGPTRRWRTARRQPARRRWRWRRR